MAATAVLAMRGIARCAHQKSSGLLHLRGTVNRFPPARLISTSDVLKAQKGKTTFVIGDEKEFDEKVLKSATPVVVDFHAEWCGPCKQLGPKLTSAVNARDGKVLLAKVDIDELADIAMKFNVNVVPTVVGVKAGKEAHRFEGNVQDDQLQAFLDRMQTEA